MWMGGYVMEEGAASDRALRTITCEVCEASRPPSFRGCRRQICPFRPKILPGRLDAERLDC